MAIKVIKDYGVVASHGSKELKLQTITVDKEKRLALVSYKDGMSFKTTDITVEAKELKRLLEDYLGYKKESEDDKAVCTLIGLPATDINYQSALSNANEKVLSKAIKLMEKNGGNNKTRIKACENALKKLDEENHKISQFPANKTTTAKANENGQKAKVYQFPNKKPDIIKLDKGSATATYEDCEHKLKEEAKVFVDSDSQYVIEGILELCKVDADFRSNVMREDKTYGGFMEFMFKAAKDGYCIRYGNVGWLDRDLGLELAIDYYNADTEKMEEERKAKAEAESKAKAKEVKSNGNNKKTTTRRKKKTN